MVKRRCRCCAYKHCQANPIAALQRPEHLKLLRAKKLKHSSACFMISEHVCIRRTIYTRVLIDGPMDAASPPDFLSRSRKASSAIPGRDKIPTSPPYNPSVPLHRMAFGASLRLPIGCIGRQRHPAQSGYRTRPYSVGRAEIVCR
jgi:hypothetical protein